MVFKPVGVDENGHFPSRVENLLAQTYSEPGTNAAIPGYGLIPKNLTKWHAALAKVRSGGGNAHILCVGTSKTWGFPNIQGYTKSWPSRMRQMLNSYFVPAAEGWVSFSGKSFNDNSGDPRIIRGNWQAVEGNGPGKGGGMYAPDSTVGWLGYNPGYSYDTIKFLYATYTNKGSVSVDIDGGASIGGVNANGTPGFGIKTLTKTLGTGQINISAPTGGDFELYAIMAYDSTKSQVLVSNLAVDASSAYNWTADQFPYYSLFTWDQLKPDLSIILHSTNDAGQDRTPTQFVNDMAKLIDKAAPYGSVIIGTESPDLDDTPRYKDAEVAYQPVIKSLAKSKSVPYLNLTNRYVSETDARAAGFISSDRVHLTAQGNADIASAVYQAVTS